MYRAHFLFGNTSKNSRHMMIVSSGNTSSRMSCIPTAPVANINAYLRRILAVIGRLVECR